MLGEVGSVAEVQFQRRSETGELVVFGVRLARGNRAEMEVAPVGSPPNSNSAPVWSPQTPQSTSSPAAVTSSATVQPAMSSAVIEPSARTHPPAAEAGRGGAASDAATKTISVLQRPLPEQGKSALEVCATHNAGKDDSTWSSRSNSSSPTERMLLERHAADPACLLPRMGSPRRKELFTDDPERAENSVRLCLTLARSLPELQRGSVADDALKLDVFDEELRVELSAALSVPVTRFHVGKVVETSAHSCQVHLIIHPSVDEDLFSTSALSGAQLAAEIQRQVADPLAPLRNAAWFSFVMNVVVTSGSTGTTPVASQGTALGAPDTHFGAPLLWAVPPDFGVGHEARRADTQEREESRGSTSGGANRAREREGMELALNELRQGQHKRSLVTRWLDDNLSVSLSHHSSSSESPRLHRCVGRIF